MDEKKLDGVNNLDDIARERHAIAIWYLAKTKCYGVVYFNLSRLPGQNV